MIKKGLRMFLVLSLVAAMLFSSIMPALAAWWSPYYTVWVEVPYNSKLIAPFETKVILYGSNGYYGESYVGWRRMRYWWQRYFGGVFYGVPKGPARIRIIFRDGSESNIYPYIYNWWYPWRYYYLGR